MSCYISGKVFNCKQRWIWLSLKSFLSLLSNQSDIKRLNNIVKVVLVYISWCGSTDQWNLPKLCPMNIYDFALCVFKVGGDPVLQWPGSHVHVDLFISKYHKKDGSIWTLYAILKLYLWFCYMYILMKVV